MSCGAQDTVAILRLAHAEKQFVDRRVAPHGYFILNPSQHSFFFILLRGNSSKYLFDILWCDLIGDITQDLPYSRRECLQLNSEWCLTQ